MGIDLDLRRTLPASPDRVWRALTDPAALSAWFWPPSFGTAVDIDLRVEGRYAIVAQKMNLAVTGQYAAVEPDRLLAMSWQWKGETDQTQVTIELAPTLAGGTELTVRHAQFRDEATRDSHMQGWSDCLSRLPAWLGA